MASYVRLYMYKRFLSFFIVAVVAVSVISSLVLSSNVSTRFFSSSFFFFYFFISTFTGSTHRKHFYAFLSLTIEKWLLKKFVRIKKYFFFCLSFFHQRATFLSFIISERQRYVTVNVIKCDQCDRV